MTGSTPAMNASSHTTATSSSSSKRSLLKDYSSMRGSFDDDHDMPPRRYTTASPRGPDPCTTDYQNESPAMTMNMSSMNNSVTMNSSPRVVHQNNAATVFAEQKIQFRLHTARRALSDRALKDDDNDDETMASCRIITRKNEAPRRHTADYSSHQQQQQQQQQQPSHLQLTEYGDPSRMMKRALSEKVLLLGGRNHDHMEATIKPPLATVNRRPFRRNFSGESERFLASATRAVNNNQETQTSTSFYTRSKSVDDLMTTINRINQKQPNTNDRPNCNNNDNDTQQKQTPSSPSYKSPSIRSLQRGNLSPIRRGRKKSSVVGGAASGLGPASVIVRIPKSIRLEMERSNSARMPSTSKQQSVQQHTPSNDKNYRDASNKKRAAYARSHSEGGLMVPPSPGRVSPPTLLPGLATIRAAAAAAASVPEQDKQEQQAKVPQLVAPSSDSHKNNISKPELCRDRTDAAVVDQGRRRPALRGGFRPQSCRSLIGGGGGGFPEPLNQNPINLYSASKIKRFDATAAPDLVVALDGNRCRTPPPPTHQNHTHHHHTHQHRPLMRRSSSERVLLATPAWLLSSPKHKKVLVKTMSSSSLGMAKMQRNYRRENIV